MAKWTMAERYSSMKVYIKQELFDLAWDVQELERMNDSGRHLVTEGAL